MTLKHQQNLSAAAWISDEVRNPPLQEMEEAILRLMEWARMKDWKGIDPYDIQEKLNIVPELTGSGTVKRVLALLCTRNDVQRLVGIRPHWISKGIGLFLQAYALQFMVRGCGQALSDAKRCVEILDRLALTPQYPYGWGYPFDWRSRITFPADTPLGACVLEIGQGFWLLYRATGDQQWLDRCRGICEHFLCNHYIDRNVGEDAVCFSYTPIDHYHVHNLNLMVGAFLSKIGKVLDLEAYQILARQCANYAIHEMKEDGGLEYWGRDQYRGEQQDNYHTGFEIRALLQISQNAEYAVAAEAADRRYDYYCANFIGPDGALWRDPKSPVRIDIHGCAEAILVHSKMSERRTDAMVHQRGAVQWTLENMQNADGTFAYRLYQKKRRVRIDRTCFIRWGQAWMLLALVSARNSFLRRIS